MFWHCHCHSGRVVAELWQSCGCINIHKDPEAVHHVAVIQLEGFESVGRNFEYVMCYMTQPLQLISPPHKITNPHKSVFVNYMLGVQIDPYHPVTNPVLRYALTV